MGLAKKKELKKKPKNKQKTNQKKKKIDWQSISLETSTDKKK